MEKKTKKGAKKLILSMCAMLVALIGTITSTFAWFTMTAAPQVGNFQVKVATVSGLEIALDTRARTGSGSSFTPNGDFKALDYKTYLNGTEVETYLSSISRLTASGGNEANGITEAMELNLTPSQTATGKAFTSLEGNQILGGNYGDDRIGRFVGAESNDVGFLEFSLYFRMAVADYKVHSANETKDVNVMFDMFDYSGDGNTERDTAGSDLRTYVTADTASAKAFNLPKRWIGGTSDLTEQGADITEPDPLDPGVNPPIKVGNTLYTLDRNGVELMIIDGTNMNIVGINLFQYFGDDLSDVFVSPQDGALYELSGTAPSTTVVPGSYDTAPFAGMYEFTSGQLRVLGVGANALRLSFAEVDNLATRAEKSGDAIIWDPRAELGTYNDNIDLNFAYDLLIASGKPATLVPAYFDDHITERGNGVTDSISEEVLITLVDTAEVDGYHYGATTVRLWIDGWDAEAFDEIMADVINIGFQFKPVTGA